jgi:HAD superfamily hydrolase (TIGR01509 family)
VLWDYDGTLVDTEGIWLDIEIEMMADRGVVWTHEQGYALVGVSARTASTAMRAALPESDVSLQELSEERATRVADRVRALPLPWRPGAEMLLTALYEAGIPCGLYSASPANVLHAGLSQLRPGVFATVVDGDSVTRGKPAPDGYLMAAGRLGFAARDCLVIEDSPSGTAAGRASGAVVLAVPDKCSLSEYPGQLLLPTLQGLSVADLQHYFAIGASQLSNRSNSPADGSLPLHCSVTDQLDLAVNELLL